MSTKPTLLFITNPISGNSPRKDLRNVIDKSMHNSGFDYEIAVSEYAGHAKKLAKDAVTEGINTVVACGGDGTINEIGTQLIGTETSLGIIPCGSGNGLAHHIGIPQSTTKAIEYLKGGHPISIDTITINETPFISIAGIGYDAKVALGYANDKGRGFHTYMKYILREYLRLDDQDFTLTVDDTTFDVKAFFISLANSNEQGYGIPISPKASLRDGLMDICIVRKPNALELPIVGGFMLTHQMNKSPKVNIIQAEHLHIKRKKSDVVNIDGEPIMMGEELDIKVLPLSLKVIGHEKQA